MKRLLAVIMIFALTLSLCGCKKTTVRMFVQEYTSGHGIAGQDFSGYREYEVKDIKEGDVIIGGYFGTDFEPAREEDVAESAWIMKIGAITSDGVEVTTREGTLMKSYGVPMELDSLIIMYDGPNYSYVITFK